MEIDVGRVVEGKYELVRLLGRGSMGEVWVAHHKSLGEHVAIKLLSRRPSAEEELEDPATATARFRFEAQVAARLSRKTRHIVRVTDHGEEEGLAYIVMELLEGETLEDILARDGRVPLATVVKTVTQVARALTRAHSDGVFHRDLKPANLFLTHDEEGKLLVKLLDFGIARASHAHRVHSPVTTAKGLVFGTPSYMSPEQARGSSKLDHRCDLWALATIAYESVCGDLPVDGKDTDELVENLCAGRITPLRRRDPQQPVPLEAFFARAFSPAIGARFQSAADFAAAFTEAAIASGLSREDATLPPPPDKAAEPSTPLALAANAAAPPARGVDAGAGAGGRGDGGGSDGTNAAQGELHRGARTRVAVVATGASLVALVAIAIAWRALVQAPPAAADTAPARPGVAAPTAQAAGAPAGSASQSPPATTVDEPGIAVSALPRAPAVAGAAGAPPATRPSGAAGRGPSASSQPPASAPPKKVDRSEVF